MTDEKQGTARTTVRDFSSKKEKGEKLVVVSAYDALFGRLADEAGVDAVLVGDSLGNVILGLGSTIPVTLEQMIHHGAAVRRGVSRAMVVVDMPFLTFQTGLESALLNCGSVIQRTGAEAVKLEGGDAHVADVITNLVRMGVPVMGHIGLTPQSVNAMGGYRVQGKGEAAARIRDEARRLEDAGAFAIVLELVPAELSAEISQSISIPTIGIGAGPGCDGQVLVLMDMLGLNDSFSPRFLKRYAELSTQVRDAVRSFNKDVTEGTFPGPEHSF